MFPAHARAGAGASSARSSAGPRPLAERFNRAWEELFGSAGGSSIFKGAENSRLTADWTPTLLSPDDETRWSLRRLRARARELARNNAYAKHFLRLLAVNLLGPRGFTLSAQVRNNDGNLATPINKKIEAGWKDWSRCVSLDGKLSRARFEHLILKAVAADGETLVRIWRGARGDFGGSPFGLALEPIDADLLDETYSRSASNNLPEVRMGVEVDAHGRAQAYHLWDRPMSVLGSPMGRKRIRVPADQIIHIYDPDRVNQTRGITWFAPIMLPLKMLGGYVEGELVAARTAASKMGFFQRKDGSDAEMPVRDDGSTEILMEAQPGTFDFAPEGYELAQWNPDHPNAAFGAFVKSSLREVSTGIGIDYNTLASDLEGVNYSSMRAGLLSFRDCVRDLQEWWDAAWYQRIYPEFLNQALLNRALVLDTRDYRKFLENRFTARGWTWVDPLKDTQAGVLAISAGLTSRTRLLAEQGIDFEEVLAELADEQELAEEAGVDVSIDPTAAAAGADKIVKAEEADDSADGTSGSTAEPKAGAASAKNGGDRSAVLAFSRRSGDRLNRLAALRSGPSRNGAR